MAGSYTDIIAYVAAAVPGAKVGSTLRSGRGSLHNVGRAVDFPGSPGSTVPDVELNRIWAALVPLAQAGLLEELFYDPKGGYDKGVSIGPIGGHRDHLHAGIAEGAVLDPSAAPVATTPSDKASSSGGLTAAASTVSAFLEDVANPWWWARAGAALGATLLIVAGLVFLFGRDLFAESAPALSQTLGGT